MTRPFGLGDLGLVWGLRGRGLTLDMQRAALWKPRPLGAALSGLLAARHVSTTLTFVCQSQETNERGFVQVLACPERLEWQVIHLAPWVESDDLSSGATWVSALADLCPLAGSWGALRIRAGVGAGGPEEEAFRQAGFAAYTREEVYRLVAPRSVATAARELRPLAARDAWPMIQLVSQVVPPAVQHAEGMSVSGPSTPVLARLGIIGEHGYVLEQGADLGAYVGLSRGAGGAWARILLRPEARKNAGDAVRQAIAAASAGPVLYCAVRDYQAGLRSLLVGMGFELVGVQVWLVKHTTRPAECYRLRHLTALDKYAEPVRTPLHPTAGAAAALCSPLTREHWMYEY